MDALRFAILVTVLGVWIVGCRDLVEPGRVDEVRNYRAVEGRVQGDGALEFSSRSLRFDTRAYGDTSISQGIWTIPVESDGSFRANVPRGTRGRADVALRWMNDFGRLSSLVFVGFDLSAARWEFEVETRRVHGQVVLPDAFDEQALSRGELTLQEEFTFGHVNLWYLDLDDEGRFDAMAPRSGAVPQFIYQPSLTSRVLDFVWPDVDLDLELTLDMGLVPRWVRLTLPEGYPESTARFYSSRGESGGNISRVWTYLSAKGAAERVWVATPTRSVSWSIFPAGGLDVRNFWSGDSLGDVMALAPDDTLEVSVGDAIVDFLITRAGSPLSAAAVTVETLRGHVTDYTGSDGRAYFAVPVGQTYYQVRYGEDIVDAWIDVSAAESVVVDLPEPDAPLTPPAPPPSATTPFRRP